MAGRTRDGGVSISQRLLSVLDCFDLSRTELSLTEIAELSGLPLSTARRLITELIRWGGLERLPNGRYRIGIRLWRIGSFAGQRELRDVALPYMHDLCAASGQNVQLTVLDGAAALVIEKLSKRGAVPIESDVGGRCPLHASGVGKVLLAYSPPSVLRELVEGGLPRIVERTIIEPGRLAATLEEVRRAGAAYCHEEMTTGVSSVAAPVFGPGRQLRGALGVVTPHTVRLDQLATAVKTAALGISRACG